MRVVLGGVVERVARRRVSATALARARRPSLAAASRARASSPGRYALVVQLALTPLVDPPGVAGFAWTAEAAAWIALPKAPNVGMRAWMPSMKGCAWTG